MENNNMQENINDNNVNINLTNNEEQKPEKNGLPFYILPVLIVLIICIIGGIFLSKLDYSSTNESGTPLDDNTTSTKPDDNNQNDNIIVTPNDEITSKPEIEEPIISNEPEVQEPTQEAKPTPGETTNDESASNENNTSTQSE